VEDSVDDHTESGSLVEQHIDIKKKAKMLRIIGPLAVLLIMFMYVYSLVNMVKAFDTEVFASQIEAQGKEVWPRINERLLAIGSKLQPELEAAIMGKFGQMNEDLGKSLQTEFLGSGEGVEPHQPSNFEKEALKHFENQVTVHENSERARRDAIIKESLPSLAEDTDENKKKRENIQAHVSKASERWCKKQFASRFDGHLEEMRNIQTTLNTHYSQNAGEATESAATGDVVLLWLELFNESVGGDDTVIHGKDTDNQ
jgi:hypothetical protein